MNNKRLKKYLRYLLASLVFVIIARLTFSLSIPVIGVILITISYKVIQNVNTYLIATLSMFVSSIFSIYLGYISYRWAIRYKNQDLLNGKRKLLEILDHRDINIIENEILDELKNTDSIEVNDGLIEEKIYRKAYLSEDWQVYYAKKRIKNLLKNR